MKCFFSQSPNLGFCACSPCTEKQQQASKYCSDIVWTQKSGFLMQNLIKDKRIMNIWKEMVSSSLRRHVLCMKPLSCWRRRYTCLGDFVQNIAKMNIFCSFSEGSLGRVLKKLALIEQISIFPISFTSCQFYCILFAKEWLNLSKIIILSSCAKTGEWP